MGAMMIHLGGRLVDAAEARVDPWDRGLTLGDGLFETIAVRAGRAAHVPEKPRQSTGSAGQGPAAAGLSAPVPGSRSA